MAVGICEEGGEHVWGEPLQPRSCCGIFFKILCCPCWVLTSCLLSTSTAGASQQLMTTGGRDGETGEVLCKKCGLTSNEASALEEMKMKERNGVRSSKGVNYFSTNGYAANDGMNLPPSPQMSSSQYPPSPSNSPRPPHPPSPIPVDNRNSTQGLRKEDQAVGDWLAALPTNPSKPQ